MKGKFKLDDFWALFLNEKKYNKNYFLVMKEKKKLLLYPKGILPPTPNQYQV